MEVILASAEWPLAVEFSACWRAVVGRMEDPDDWNMPRGAEYCRNTLLQWSCDPSVLVSALWLCGLSQTALGYHGFVSNSQERSWRTLKYIFPKGYRAQDPVECTTRLCGSLKAKLAPGFWNDFSHQVSTPIDALIRSAHRLQSEHMHIDSFVEVPSADAPEMQERQYTQKRRQNLHLLKMWFDEHGADATFLHRDLDSHPFTVNREIVLADGIWVLPKYNMSLASGDRDAVCRCLELSLARSEAEVIAALGWDNVYSFSTHRFLRQSFTAVIHTTQHKVFNLHCDFVRSSGQSEHAFFVQGLVQCCHMDRPWDRPAGGPRRAAAKAKAQPKRNQASQALIVTPRRRVAAPLPGVANPPESVVEGALDGSRQHNALGKLTVHGDVVHFVNLPSPVRLTHGFGGVIMLGEWAVIRRDANTIHWSRASGETCTWTWWIL